MNTLREFLPKPVVEMADKVYDEGCKVYEQACKHYLSVNEQMRLHVRDHVPEDLKPLATKIIGALPETVFSLSVVSNIGKEFAIGAWLIRAIQILSPLTKPLFSGQIEKETLDAALQESWNKIEETVEKFKPAALVSCTVAAVFYGVVGIVTLNVNNLFQGSLFALAATMAHQSMNLKASEPKDQSGSTGPAVSKSSTS